jgi:hypothetical protein
MPPVSEFPLSLFPPIIADYWRAAAESLNVPVDYVAVPSLSLLGAAIGRSRAASVKRTYSEPPLFWTAVVAPPGRAKSPALQFAKGSLSSHTRRWRERHREAITGSALAEYRRQHAGPVLTAFAGWLAEHRPRVLPKSSIGEAFTYAKNQWPTLDVYLTDGRLTIDNAAAEQAIRPLAVGRRNWLHLGGDGGLKPTAVLLSTSASAKRQGINPWVYLKHVLTELPARPPSADLTDLLPDVWIRSRAGQVAVPA